MPLFTTIRPPASPRAPRPVTWPIPLALALLASACGTVEEPPQVPLGVVDSVFPIDEEIRRFAATLDSVPAALYDGAASREELVRRFIRAVETRNADELARLVLQRDEFIGLYYPHTRYTARPYELAPALLWFRMESPSSRGLSRLLERMGGRDLDFEGLACPGEPLVEERNRIWEHCTVRVRGADGRHAERRLFGAILEREGRWKFLSYANEF
jgi:hypothetical protein